MRLLALLTAFIISLTTAFTTTASTRNFTEGWTQKGITSFYHRSLNGNRTANGERYNHMGAMTAAHRTLPFGSVLRVTDSDTGKSIIVTINDRGPFHGNRVLDLSGKAATKLGIVDKGLCNTKLEVLSIPQSKTYMARQNSKTKRAEPIVQMVDTPRKVFGKNRIDSIGDLIASNFDTNKLN